MIMPVPTVATLLCTLALVAGPVVLQTTEAGWKSGPEATRAGTLPPGWTARADQGGDSTAIRFQTMEPGYHLTLGPAAILYRAEDHVGGPFHTLATFHQMKKPPHPEGYGLFVGGQELAGKDQRYTYFLIRGDGSYLIKRRSGDKTQDVTKGWIPHPAVKKEDGQGKATNLLEIDAKKDPTHVVFKVNGQTVYTADSKSMDFTGNVGLRANHHLDIHIEGFAIHE
jgi:hypothetical protein